MRVIVVPMGVRRRRGPLTAALLVSAAVAGCDPAGVLVVHLRTDLRSPDEVTHARVRLLAGAYEVERLTALPVGTAVEPLRVLEAPSVPPGDVEVVLDLFDGLDPVVGRVVNVAEYRGEHRVVTVLITRDCRGESRCPDGDDPQATECLGGRCVRRECTPETPELCPEEECAGDADCASEGECRSGRCVEGSCFAVLDDARCGVGLRCGEAGVCAPMGDDAGSPGDAGPMDAGTDAASSGDGGGSPDGGSACEPPGCDDGDPCTDDACIAGACSHAPNTAPCDDGMFCNGADTCGGGSCSVHAGDPCSGGAVCDEGMDRCTGCLVTADCGPPVVSDWSACGDFSGACDSTGTEWQTTTTFTCVDGACVGSDTMASRGCTRVTGGTSCGSGETCCSDACVSTATSLAHCGGCGAACVLPHATPVCVGGDCRIGTCDAGWGNCNGTAGDGCEQSLQSTSHCGACDARCATNEGCNSSGLCNCGTDASGPGGTGQSVCTGTLPNASAERCAATVPRRCAVVSCDPGYGDCDGAGWNGCEIHLNTNAAHCSACGNACGTGETCSGGRCWCGATGGSTSPACSSGQVCRSCGCVPATETFCRFSSPDEDCDGMANCDDPDCLGRVCDAAGGLYCVSLGVCG